VIGASGYIGFAVAQVFRQNGYKVYGVVRKPEQAKRLAAHEIHPVVGDAAKPETYLDALKNSNVVVDTLGFDPSNSLQSTVFTATKQHSSPHGKKIFIFTSGILVHGHHDEVVREEQLSCPSAIQVRVQQEAEVVQAKEIHGIVIRPGFVYGYAGGNGGTHLGDKVFNLHDGKIVITGKGDKKWSWIHIHDLAHAYLLAAQKFTVANGQIFDIGSPNPPSYEEFRKKAAAVAGHKNAEVVTAPVPAGEFFAQLLETTVRVSPKKAEHLLGWKASHPELLDDLEPVYEAYKAHKAQ